jgi:hypothetical protein
VFAELADDVAVHAEGYAIRVEARVDAFILRPIQ